MRNLQSLPNHFKPPDDNNSLLMVRVKELRESLGLLEPAQLGAKTGVSFYSTSSHTGSFHLSLWGREIEITYPAFQMRDSESQKEPGAAYQALVAYYFSTADGSPLEDRWISFSDLPDGRFYTQAFQSYTGLVLARHFRDDLSAFSAAARRLGGIHHDTGSAAFAFQILPLVSLLAICWLGDEDFPTSYQVLFNASTGHYLPTDACAIAGSMLTRRLTSQNLK